MESPPEQPTTSATLVAEWRRSGILRSGSRISTSGSRISRASRIVGVSTTIIGGSGGSKPGRDDLTATTGSDNVIGADSDLPLLALPEVLLGVSLVVRGDRTPEGVVIQAVAPAWILFLNELLSDPQAFFRLDPWQLEELVAGGYQREGWSVTLTPRSGDHGRDIIAVRNDVGAIRVLDQVKRYTPSHIVTADDVRAIYGVLNLDPKASKAVITTTSGFAAGVYDEFASVMPSRVELRDGKVLRKWLTKFGAK